MAKRPRDPNNYHLVIERGRGVSVAHHEADSCESCAASVASGIVAENCHVKHSGGLLRCTRVRGHAGNHSARSLDDMSWGEWPQECDPTGVTLCLDCGPSDTDNYLARP